MLVTGIRLVTDPCAGSVPVLNLAGCEELVQAGGLSPVNVWNFGCCKIFPVVSSPCSRGCDVFFVPASALSGFVDFTTFPTTPY